MTDRIRALTFNVRHGVGLDGVQDLERTARVLEELAPDVAGLQEVDEGAERSGFADQAAWLAGALGLEVASAPARGRRPHERVALLSRFPLSEPTSMWFWRGGMIGEARGAVIAHVETSVGAVTCAVAHLSTRPRERRRERRALSRMIAGLSGPVVLFLDANGAELEPLERSGLRPPPGTPVPTFPAQEPTHAFDWILARPPLRHLSAARAIGCDASDHLPLVGILGC